METEEKDLCKKCKHYWVDFIVNPDKNYIPLCEIADKNMSDDKTYHTYEEACEAGIKHCLEILI